ncbi:MAG: FAD-dependent monooxygenase [Luminiphilus sp.]|nr:FAD-dependent monooxygenase [Luminiphilus sp.]MDG1460868.1 FAD-dependent monooxygenase [Luminiphilus sp.]
MRVEIVGGGMVGLAFAIALKRSLPLAAVRVLEARVLPSGVPSPLDSRATALNLASRDILDSWGIWRQIAAAGAAIRAIHVSSRGRFGSAIMEASDVGEAALGYVVENHHVGAALLKLAADNGVLLQAPAGVTGIDVSGPSPLILRGKEAPIPADLVVIADGADSALCRSLGVNTVKREVEQRAVAANVRFEGASEGTAWERFTEHGPLALLPLPDDVAGSQRYNLIWSMHPDESRAMENADDAEFLQALQRAVGWRLGRLTDVGRRTAWNLSRIAVQEQVRAGVVIAGNAAHTLHPVAGQGFNLSLRDASRLAQILAVNRDSDEGSVSLPVLRRYESAVGKDQQETTRATDFLATLFRSRGVFLDLPRDAALVGLDLLVPLRRTIARRGTGKGMGLVHEVRH